MHRRLPVALVVFVVGAGAVQATFAASTGFSGRNGFDCSACHAADPITPAADIAVTGLPDRWGPAAVYDLTVRVSGGPPALPALAPQGGFEISTDVGGLAVPPAMEGLLRMVGTDGVTYTPDGTLMREWEVRWEAPGRYDWPRDARVWVAALAANGDHVIATNASDGGERGDAAAAAVFAVPAEPAVVAAWQALPLAPLLPETPRVRVASGETAHIAVAVPDDNATEVLWRQGGDAVWQWVRPDQDRIVRLSFTSERDGTFPFHFRAEGADRASPRVTVYVEVGDKASSAPGLVIVGLGLWAARRLRA